MVKLGHKPISDTKISTLVHHLPLSKTTTADEKRIEHTRRALGQ
jgi:hypothetical protein